MYPVKFVLKLFYLVFIILSFVSVAEGDDEFRNLWDEATEKKLFKSKKWINLVQYWQVPLRGTLSRVDDPKYFLSKEGKFDPESELKSTLSAFFNDKDDNDENPQCKYPARFKFLNETLNLVEKGVVKKSSCQQYEDWKKELSVEKIFVIFPSAYLNNPASMFGHTLFRLDSGVSKNNPLLSYAVNFGAATGSDGGVMFALKGLAGGYKAGFTVEPYYQTVERYGDIENRDIWEYELLLSDDEIEDFLSLLWELKKTYFDYYFFDENCSFYVLALLEFVKPELDLLKKLPIWIIPTDTLKVLTLNEDLIGDINYRPSLATRLESYSEIISRNEIRLAKKIAKPQKMPDKVRDDLIISLVESNDKTKISRTLEFSFDYLMFKAAKNKDPESDRKIAGKILRQRSKLPPLEKIVIKEPEARPDHMHTSGRLLLSAGGREKKGFYNISIKPAYHDALDKPDGFKEGAAIDFFHLNLRQYENSELEIFSFYPVTIESYTPWGDVFKPASWDVKTGIERELIPKNNKNEFRGSLVTFLEGSAGATFNVFSDLNLSTLISSRINFAPRYETDVFALGLGPKIRLVKPLLERVRWLGEGSYLRFEPGQSHTSIRALSEIQFDLLGNFLIRSGVRYEKSFSIEAREAFIGLGVYF